MPSESAASGFLCLQLALKHKVLLHSDACLGGFVLPFARKLGYRIPPFDFSVAGVTSMSVDSHKFGMAHKGTSIVLYRNAALRRHQYTKITEWSGGLYISPGTPACTSSPTAVLDLKPVLSVRVKISKERRWQRLERQKPERRVILVCQCRVCREQVWSPHCYSLGQLGAPRGARLSVAHR